MNNTGIPTKKKVGIPLRIPYEVYQQMVEYVHEKKKEDRGYSFNQYLTELLTKDLKKKK